MGSLTRFNPLIWKVDLPEEYTAFIQTFYESMFVSSLNRFDPLRTHQIRENQLLSFNFWRCEAEIINLHELDIQQRQRILNRLEREVVNRNLLLLNGVLIGVLYVYAQWTLISL